MSNKLTRSHEEATIERFKRDPALAAEFLDAVLLDGDEGELLQGLKLLAKAFGGVTDIAARARVNAKSLYRALSRQGNPELKTLVAVLKAMGLRLSVQPLGQGPASPAKRSTAARRGKASKAHPATAGARVASRL